MGARFAKWRAVIAMGDGIPSRGCIEANAQALARYAALCQEAGLVPVVEPEVLMDGEHTLERCGEVTEEVLRTVFNELYTQRVTLEGMILKPNMVLPGSTCPKQEAVDEVADATVECLLRAVPAAVPRSLPIGRTIQGTGLGPSQCHECPIQVATTLGGGVFVRSCHPATGLADMAWQAAQRGGGPARPLPPSEVRRAAPWHYDAATERDRWGKPRPTSRIFCHEPVGLDGDGHADKKFIAGNWKMYTTAAAAKRLAGDRGGAGVEERVTVAVCPPFPYLALVGEILKGSRIALGAQNLYPEKEGPSPARSVRRCSSMSAASTSSSATASAGTSSANPMRSSTARYGPPWPPDST